ncbi:hypothetical protein [Candidatus Nitrotoga sp. 1052]|uniref:hypothetical protein n=1 Tax=Candidatus Nitrotoga sp. 1052 TaxID=2886964 RepID=UPI001EF3F88F|nr:hypothetical protein [Candidatus Nitrotoga sp. 1052]
MTPNFPKQLIAPLSAFDNKIELTLSEQGMICDCNIPTGDLFGYRRGASAWGHISELMPELAAIKLMRDGQINPRLRFLSHIGHRFQLISLGGKLFDVKFFIRAIENQGQRYLRAMIFPFEVGFNAVGSNG